MTTDPWDLLQRAKVEYRKHQEEMEQLKREARRRAVEEHPYPGHPVVPPLPWH
jgi:hypothetical protein